MITFQADQDLQILLLNREWCPHPPYRKPRLNPRTRTRRTGNVRTRSCPHKIRHPHQTTDRKHPQVLLWSPPTQLGTWDQVLNISILCIWPHQRKTISWEDLANCAVLRMDRPQQTSIVIIIIAVVLVIVIFILVVVITIAVHKIRLHHRCQFPTQCFLLESKSNRHLIAEPPSFTLPLNFHPIPLASTRQIVPLLPTPSPPHLTPHRWAMGWDTPRTVSLDSITMLILTMPMASNFQIP